jgi:ribosomal protein S18 acetylase RimI-like enzyme
MIDKYISQDTEDIINLWNRAAVKLGYKEMDTACFTQIFTKNPYFHSDHTFVMKEDGAVVGFACACVGDDIPLGKVSGYITCILLDEKYETRDNYRKFMDLLEDSFAKSGRIQSDILFFNPMMLPWYIKGTDRHEHNNAPGVFKNSRLYQELMDYGYEERATECAMHMNLDNYAIPATIWEKVERAAKDGYQVSLFDKSKHYDLDTMLQKLDNPLWEKEIKEAAREGAPVLVAAQNGRTVGFAGPIRRQESGRGYFTGIGVNKEHEGHGLGTILFFLLCKEEKKVGAGYMSLYTGKTNPAAKIYLQAGFHIVEEFAVMRKELKTEDQV